MPPLEGTRKGYSNDIPTSFAKELVEKFRVAFAQSVPLRVGVKWEEFDEDEGTESCPFCELVGGLMCLAISTRPDMSNAVRTVVRGWSTPKAIHWKAALGILACIHQWWKAALGIVACIHPWYFWL